MQGSLVPEGLMAAEELILKDIQKEVFDKEIRSLQQSENLPRSNQLAFLCPFIAGDKILRVGGRLKNASLPFESKHPVILPGNHRVTKMLIE